MQEHLRTKTIGKQTLIPEKTFGKQALIPDERGIYKP